LKQVLVVVAAVLAIAPAAHAARPKPVPSLTPAATKALWHAEVTRANTHPRVFSDATCRPGRAVFYAQTDWLRLATKLAQQPSPCAQYYVSVPPLAADKSQPRAGQAAQIRALGPQFHAVDEISWNGWSSWVTANASTWYDAGVTARQRMAAAGYDVAAGDAWALNELSSAVRKGTGTSRRNALDFLHGLSADGAKGIVFVAGIGQGTPDLGPYKANLQNWLQDAAFWTEAAGYVSDWAQENYGDIRNYAVSGTTPQQRRDALVQYLTHEPTLANAGPDTAGAARDLLRQTYVPFGNAAWAWSSAYGWTAAPLATMQDFVSGEVYAARAFAAASGSAVDRVGFAWAPSNTLGLTATDFNAQTAAVLDRVAAAIRDSASPSDDTGVAACAPAWCATTLDGAAFVTAWQSFSAWSTSSVAFASAPFALTAGTVSAPVTLQVQTAGAPDVATADQVIAIATTSPGGGLSTAASGPFTPTLSVTIPTGASSATFYYTDTLAGAPTITAGAVAQQESVVAAPLAKLSVSPATSSVRTSSAQPFAATGSDAFGNAVAVAPAWALSTTILGRLSTATGPTTTFTASSHTGSVRLTASAGGLSAAAAINVFKPRARVAGVGTKMVGGHVVAVARVLAGAAPAAGVPLTLRVRRGSSILAVVLGRTDGRGTLQWRSKKPLKRGRYVASAVIRTASTASRTQQLVR
jgi:hypothetical protein